MSPRADYYRRHRAELAERERRRWYAAQGRPVPPKHVPHGRLTRFRASQEPPSPPPALERGHPAVEAAIAALRPYERAELGGDMDAIALDIIGAFCLATAAGEDPMEAARRERARYRHDRAALVYGLNLVDDLKR